MKDAGIVDVRRAVGAIDEQVARIRLLNLERNEPIIKTLMELRTALLNERQVTMPNGRTRIEARGQSLPQIEQLRKSAGQAFGDPSMASIKQLGEDALQKFMAQSTKIWARLSKPMDKDETIQSGKLQIQDWQK